MLGLPGKSNALVGLDIGTTSVKLLELGKSRGGYQLQSCAIEPLPERAVVEKNINEPDAVGAAIKRLVERSGTRARQAAVAIARSAVISRTIDMDADLPEDEMESRLQLDAEQYIPYPLEEVAFDFEVQGPSPHNPARVEVLLTASRRENVEIREEVLALGGLTMKVVDVEAHCMQRAFHLFANRLPADQQRVIAIVDIGASMTTLSVLADGGAPFASEQLFGGQQLTEDIQRHYGLPAEEAEQAKRQRDLPDDYAIRVLMPFKEAVVQQVVRMLQSFFASSDRYDDVDHILLAGGCAAVDGLAHMVADKLGTPCSIADPFAAMSISPKVDATAMADDAPAMLLACGLALRNFERPPPSGR